MIYRREVFIMNLEEMKRKKKELHLTCREISSRSGIPLGTVQKIFGGVTASPRYETLGALERVLTEEEHARKSREVLLVSSPKGPEQACRGEMIDGKVYPKQTPGRTHQRLVLLLAHRIQKQIEERSLPWEVNIGPFPVYLKGDDSVCLEPDLFICCSPSLLQEKGCMGAPDWVIEVLSPSSARLDLGRKCHKYREEGVKYYWAVDPGTRVVLTHSFAGGEFRRLYAFRDPVPVEIGDDFAIRIADFLI
jgi:Uma2 family endonuclease